jgi:hypothetical protein
MLQGPGKSIGGEVPFLWDFSVPCGLMCFTDFSQLSIDRRDTAQIPDSALVGILSCSSTPGQGDWETHREALDPTCSLEPILLSPP